MSAHAEAGVFAKFATRFADWAGHPTAFVGAVALVLIWGISGPFFGFSETLQLVVNAGTTIITFLMVFILQISHRLPSGTDRQISVRERKLTIARNCRAMEIAACQNL